MRGMLAIRNNGGNIATTVEDAMFGLIKPAHIQMRAVLPNRAITEFDQVLASFEESVPTYWEKGARARAVAIVMGEWIESKIAHGDFSISPVMRAKVGHLTELAVRFNDKDYSGDGHLATIFARDVVRAFREAGIIPID